MKKPCSEGVDNRPLLSSIVNGNDGLRRSGSWNSDRTVLSYSKEALVIFVMLFVTYDYFLEKLGLPHGVPRGPNGLG